MVPSVPLKSLSGEMNMSKNKLRFVLVLIWISCLIVLLLADALILSHPTQNGLYAPHRLVLPSPEIAMSIPEDMSRADVINILGYPTGYDPSTSSAQVYWDLQFGYRLRSIWTSSGYWNYFSGQQEHYSWLILPGIMLLVAVIEIIVYLVISKEQSGSK